MTIQNKPFFVLSMIAAAVFLYFVGDRVVFLVRAERTGGTVGSLSAANATCGSRRSRYPCTKFSAEVRFAAGGADPNYSVTVSAGSVRGYSEPLSRANYQVGAPVQVVFNPRDPLRAYRDSVWDVWGAPVIALMFQLVTLFGSFREPRGRDNPGTEQPITLFGR